MGTAVAMAAARGRVERMEDYRSREFLHQNRTVRAMLIGVALLCTVVFAAVATMEANDSAWSGAWWVGAATVVVTLAPLWASLTVAVDETHVRISLMGVMTRDIALADIVAVEHRTYRPIREFGGWGWRWSLSHRNRVAYATRGDTAVVLTLRDGGEVYLGVDDEPALAQVLASRIDA